MKRQKNKIFHIRFRVILLIVFGLLFRKILALANYFFALTLHELAHVFVACKRGYKLKSFNIDIFGVSVDLDDEVDDRDSFIINLAGPMMNILLAVCCMASFWLFPKSVCYFGDFMLSNIVLAGFNLLPVYPLDGGKIFRSIFSSDRVYKHLDRVIRYCIVVLFLVLFICSCMKSPNFFILIIAIFFITSKGKKTPTFSVLKNPKHTHEKVHILKLSGNSTILMALKMINRKYYTIFYLDNKFVSEEQIISYATAYSMDKKICECLHD